MPRVCKCQRRGEEGLGSGAGPVTGAKLLDLGVKNQICIICSSNKHS